MRPIDADKAIEVAQIKYNDWNLAMAAADGRREINLCFKKQELFKAVKTVLDCVPTLTPPNEWVGVEKGLPELPDASWCSRSVIVCDKDGDVAPLLWARAQVRGKTVERWKYHWGRIYDGPEITHWMSLPAPPDRRPPEGEDA